MGEKRVQKWGGGRRELAKCFKITGFKRGKKDRTSKKDSTQQAEYQGRQMGIKLARVWGKREGTNMQRGGTKRGKARLESHSGFPSR